jgi:hypothetical protein
MDPGVTLGVLCDQIIPPEYAIDEEEQQIRDRLRSLVIAFLKVDAVESIIRKYTKTPGTDTENVLVSQLLMVTRCTFPPFRKADSFTGYQKAGNSRRRGDNKGLASDDALLYTRLCAWNGPSSCAYRQGKVFSQCEIERLGIHQDH